MLLNEKSQLASHMMTPFSMAMPGYNLATGMNPNGSAFANVDRTGETQGFMDRLLAGLGADQNSYQDLLSQITPGFGRLSQSQQEQIKNTYAQKYGDLRQQLAKRRILGSSFADADLQRMDLEKDQQMRAAAADSMVKELQMTSDVLKAQTDGRNQTISTALSQIQFEGNMGINLTNMVMTSMNNNLAAQQDLIKLAASLKVQGATAAGNISGNLAGSVTSSYPQYAQLSSQEGIMPTIATLGGALLGNTSLFGGGKTA
jgi:hypothetical protein